MFMSMNVARGSTLSRRDDIESVFYLLFYLLNRHKLPWNKFQDDFSKKIINIEAVRRLRSSKEMIN